MPQSIFGAGPLIAVGLIVVIVIATLKAALRVSHSMTSQVGRQLHTSHFVGSVL